MERFRGKIAIITGSGRGIGQGIAKRFAREGASVVIADYDADSAAATAEEISATGGRAMACPVDISDVGAINQMVADVVAHFGRIDILVNNAGVIQTKPMMDVSESDWDHIINVNQRGTFFMLQTVAEQMIQQLPEGVRGDGTPADVFVTGDQNPFNEDVTTEMASSHGKIVNIASIAARKGRPLATAYAASKSAIVSITQSAALALAPYRINVNAVCPGLVPTPMWEQIDKDRADLFGAEPGEAVRSFINIVPLKRASTPEDIAGAVTFLCSEDADCITGQALNVDGGYEMN
ncbi:SDR family oxidoreductase [Chloroflexi bacterium TSY]|nr:SDR family oxidoreductase [Chloroflexi bacterium TSY]